MWSTDTSKLPLTLGRVPPSEVVLKDSEVSGKHAMIKWNSNVIFCTVSFLILAIALIPVASLVVTSCLFVLLEIEMGANRHG